jgi:hypothetical protein
MSNYKILNLPHFTEIQNKLLEITAPQIEKSEVFHLVDNEPFLNVDLLWEDLKQYGVTSNDLDYVAVIRAKKIFGAHCDVLEKEVALNFPLVNCENTHLVFYKKNKNAKHVPLKTEKNLEYFAYKLKDLEEVERVSYVNEAVVFRPDAIHDVIGASDEHPRITVSIRFKDNITFGL